MSIGDFEQIGGGLLVFAALCGTMSIVYTSWRNGITPMPTTGIVSREVARELRNLKSGGTLVDAGSGWGTLAFHLLRSCPDWRIVGIENSPLPLCYARLARRLLPALLRNKVRFERGDLYRYPYGQADAVVCYLHPAAMKRLGTILKEQLHPGTPVVSVFFTLPGWQPIRVVTCRDLYRTKVHVYEAGSANNVMPADTVF
ncbi:class I SAM-dependent methyltransferase [Paenibacillus aurantiacus]|uniref:Class I SAM-dependent methyltransferase n=1 Tax=Paenibacillus aurantiacus TaxID=1936118 RepID=A0ABV5KSF0_9BACL